MCGHERGFDQSAHVKGGGDMRKSWGSCDIFGTCSPGTCGETSGLGLWRPSGVHMRQEECECVLACPPHHPPPVACCSPRVTQRQSQTEAESHPSEPPSWWIRAEIHQLGFLHLNVAPGGRAFVST